MLVLFNIAPAVWSEWCLQRIDGAALNLAIFEIVYPLVISLIPIPGKGEGHFGEMPGYFDHIIKALIPGIFSVLPVPGSIIKVRLSHTPQLLQSTVD